MRYEPASLCSPTTVILVSVRNFLVIAISLFDIQVVAFEQRHARVEMKLNKFRSQTSSFTLVSSTRTRVPLWILASTKPTDIVSMAVLMRIGLRRTGHCPIRLVNPASRPRWTSEAPGNRERSCEGDVTAASTKYRRLRACEDHKGTRVLVELTRVNDEVWLPKLVQLHFDARVALSKSHDLDVEQTYRDYKKFRTDTKITVVGRAAVKRARMRH